MGEAESSGRQAVEEEYRSKQKEISLKLPDTRQKTQQHYKHTSCKDAIRRRAISVANEKLQITDMQGSRMRLASHVSQLRSRDASCIFPGQAFSPQTAPMSVILLTQPHFLTCCPQARI
jgi:hypothetical protein